MNRATAVVAGVLAAFAAAFAVAIVLAIVDLYLTGHSLPSLSGPLIDQPAIGVSLSTADLILLLVAAGAGLGVGWALWTGLARR